MLNKTTRLLISLSLLSLVIAQTACTNAEAPLAKVKLSEAQHASYERSCKNCHEVPATSAPQTGDTETWQDILDDGLSQTIERAINGYQGMPPNGQCFECTPDDIKTLIIYMAQAVKN